MASEVELKSGLTVKSLAFSIPLALIFAYLSVVLGLYTDKPGTFGTFLLPMIYIVIIMELLGRASPKLRLTPQEYVFIFSVFTFLGMHSYLAMHAAAHGNPLNIPIYGAFSDYLAFGIGDLRDSWSKAVPSAIIPPEPVRFDIATMLLNGRAPGQAVPWGYLMTSIVYWGLIYLFYSFISIFVTFAFGRVWIEEERLVFPMALPSLHLFKEAGEVDPTTNKSRIFDFKLATTKVFWGMFLIGMVTGIAPVVTELWPAFPAAAWWGETNVGIPFLAQAIPGAYAAFIFFLPLVAIGLILPNDVLLTQIIGWLVFGVIYQGLAVAMGWMAYTPGMEFVWNWDGNAGCNLMPFPYKWFAANGMGLAIPVWCIFTQRKRLASVFSSLWKGGKERELPLRIIPALLLIGGFGWYALMLVEGADPLIALLVPLWMFLFNILCARIYSEIWWFVTGYEYIWEPTYLAGVSLRGWPAPESVTWSTPNTDPAWFTINKNLVNVNNWNVLFSPLSAGNMMILYKIAYELKIRLKDFLIALLIGAIILLFIFVPLDTYFIVNTRGGINQLGDRLLGWWPWIAQGHYHKGRSAITGLTIEYNLLYLYGLGFLLGIVLYILKTKIPFLWFINIPALYVVMVAVTYMWMTSLIALIIKFVVIRTVGIKKYEEYAIPIVAGWILGFGAMWLPAAILNLVGPTATRFSTLFAP
ncbi:MAG: hypothetical protein FGF52_02635 [Candidatus Brockarchaeota archaeon]|nr:hypothetical protein [Candidatus Brockarchaeota archaeon]